MQLFSADPKIFLKKFKLIFVHKKLKKRASKVAYNRPRPFYFTVQSSKDHSPQPRIDFSYYEISATDICSLICASPSQFAMSLMDGHHNKGVFQTFWNANSCTDSLFLELETSNFCWGSFVSKYPKEFR